MLQATDQSEHKNFTDLNANAADLQIVTASEWQARRARLLEEEKAATQLLAELAVKRRQLGKVIIDAADDIHFTDSTGTKRSLLDLFDGHRQLILYDFMLSDEDSEGCNGCSFVMDHVAHLGHLRSRDTTFAATASASIEKINSFKERMEWDFPFYSSKGAFLDIGRSKGAEITWPPAEGLFGIAVFARVGRDVFHTYSTTMRGVENMLSTYALLDLTPLGRQEVGNGIVQFRLHDQY